ncbi:MAG: acetyl-CoA carboxylase biotin carboxylase subunit [Chloroflexota bacterium]
MIQKVLIANRGEIAVRIIRTCQEMGIRTVAVYSAADETSQHVLLADEAVPIGSAPPFESYLSIERVIDAAKSTACDAVHPGYGFLSENAEFAERVGQANLIFIGPSAEAIRLMGSKIKAREIMKGAGVPIVAGHHLEDNQAQANIHALAKEIGYPLFVKAAAGGGGKGMRLVEQEAELDEAIDSAKREAYQAFGNDQVFLEKYVLNPHHIEFQICGDVHGNIVHLFERECSIQRRHQKIIEESPSPLLDDDLRDRMGQAAIVAAKAVNYVNAGTVEFLADEAGNFYFLEMNTRLQVEHPVTEMVTGIDLVRLQIMIANDSPLHFQQDDVSQRGHAIECRIYAEDPANGFLPETGTLLQVSEPSGPDIRVDSGFNTNNEVTLHYDPMLAKLIVRAENRENAIQKMRLALQEFDILGVRTNIAFLQDVVDYPAFQTGDTTTNFIEQYFSGWGKADEEVPEIALIAAALAEYQSKQTPSTQTIRADRLGEDMFSPWQNLGPLRLGLRGEQTDED